MAMLATLDPDVLVDQLQLAVAPAAFQPPGALGEATRTVLLWCYYYVFIHVLYYGMGTAGRAIVRKASPRAETLQVTGEAAHAQMIVSEMAFPLCELPCGIFGSQRLLH